ncbi:MAG: hypothetical protein QXQ94_07845 [Candidatus Bathyarchaeia archaeon]
MPKTARKLMITRRIAELREEYQINTQQLRTKTIQNLQELFNIAASLAKGETKTQTSNGKTEKLTLKQRQMWARVATYIAQTINSISSTFDERQIDQDLAKLEQMINEAAAKNQTQTT